MTTGWGSITVKVGWASSAFNIAPTLTDVTADILAISTKACNRQSPFDPFAGGSASIVLDNRARNYDPLFAAGPYFGNLKPLRQVQIAANDSGSTTRRVWTGFIMPPPDGFAFDYPNGRDATVTLNCVDGFMFLDAFMTIPAIARGTMPGAAITALLAAAGWPASWQSIDAGCVVLQDILDGATVGDLARLITETERGAFYFDASNTATFDGRHAVLTDARMSSSQATFSDTGSNVDFEVIEWWFGGNLRNDWQITKANGTMQESSDATSITDNGTIIQSETGLVMDTDAEAFTIAEWGVKAFKDPLFVPKTIQIEATDSTAALDQALQRVLRDRVTLTWTPPGGGASNSANVFIEGIEHTIPVNDAPNYWTTKFSVQAADRFGWTTPTQYLVLDDATHGKLDTAKLAF